MFSLSISTEICCHYNSASQMQMRKTHIQHQASLLASANTFFPQKTLFPCFDNAETYITTYIYTLSE